MAITKILHINESPGEPTQHLRRAIDYICNPDKTRKGNLIGTLNCDKSNVLQAMQATKEMLGKEQERQAYHMILSFNPGEVDADTAFQIMAEFAKDYIGMDYECVFSVHEDKDHIHGHLIFNSVSCTTGRKYHYSNGDWARSIQPVTNGICERYGLETIDVAMPGVCRKENYAYWEDHALRKSELEIGSLLREKIDQFIPQCASVDDLVDRLRADGITVRRGKYLSLRLPGQKKGIRTRRLGAAYTLESIEKRIKGEEPQLPVMEVSGESSPLIQRAGYRIAGRRSKLKNEQWKYRAEIEQLQILNRSDSYMAAKGIRTLQDIESLKIRLTELAENIATERTRLFTERQHLKDAILILKNHPAEEAKELLKQQGYNPEEIIAFEANSAKQIANLYDQKRSVNRELRMLDTLETAYNRQKQPPDTERH